jgi:hypothetical protein
MKYKISLLSFFLMLFVVSSVNAFITENITATQTGMLDFQEYANLTEDEMNGTIDVTDKLQDAVNHARNSFKTLFIPSGTYLVSKPIDCIVTHQSSHRGHGAVIIVGSQKERPLIRLQNNAPDFQGTGLPSQTNGPRPIFGLRSVDYPSKNSDWLFYCGIRSINFDLGWGNPGAIAISWASAQNSFVEEVTVWARDGFAGIAGLPGANALTVNVDVHGGRYGLYLTRNEDNRTLWAQASVTTIVGCRLYNQTENSIRINGWGGVTLVGLYVEKQNGTAFWLGGGNNPNSCPLVVIDSSVKYGEANTSNRAIDNSGRSTIGLREFYTKNASNISFTNNDENLVPSGDIEVWTRVERYHYVSKTPKRISNYDMPGMHHIQGDLTSDDVIVMHQQSPPDNLITKHIWPFTPSFEDDGVVLITTTGGNHRQRIQDAIDNHSRVMLAAGNYILDGPIVLRDSTILFGSPGMRVIFAAASSWSPTDHVWMIETDDVADASIYLFEVSTDPPRNDYWGSIRWRAGKNSIVRNVGFGRTSGGHERDIKRVYITGNGGGRWYNYNDHKNLWDNPEVSENHRKVMIEGTSQPLTFYGLNLERGGNFKGVVSEFPMVEIKDASNVRILGGKSETYQPYARIINSDNILLANIQDWGIHNRYASAQHYIVIEGENSSNIEVMNSQWNRPPNEDYKIVFDPWTDNTPHRSMHMGLYKVGDVDFEPFLTEGMVLSADQPAEKTDHSWRVYPNPSSDGQFHIRGHERLGQVMVYDITGRLLISRNFDDMSGVIRIPTPGVYILRSEKIIIK